MREVRLAKKENERQGQIGPLGYIFPREGNRQNPVPKNSFAEIEDRFVVYLAVLHFRRARMPARPTCSLRIMQGKHSANHGRTSLFVSEWENKCQLKAEYPEEKAGKRKNVKVKCLWKSAGHA
jgi:hypothetical protein